MCFGLCPRYSCWKELSNLDEPVHFALQQEARRALAQLKVFTSGYDSTFHASCASSRYFSLLGVHMVCGIHNHVDILRHGSLLANGPRYNFHLNVRAVVVWCPMGCQQLRAYGKLSVAASFCFIPGLLLPVDQAHLHRA